MRLVSWNMGYWKPGHYKTIRNRRRQWALLAAFAPDIALLQECRPCDLAKHAPAWMAEEYDVIGEVPERWGACSAVLSRKPFAAQALARDALPSDARRWLNFLSGYVAAAVVSIGEKEMRVASVHSIAMEVDNPAVTDADHVRIRRPSLNVAWYNDLAAAALSPWVADCQFIVGGDWNTALLFDTTYPSSTGSGPGASAEFFSARSASGWRQALRKFHCDEIRTYLDPLSSPYELDHVFIDADLYGRLHACNAVDQGGLAELSDHAPVVADFT